MANKRMNVSIAKEALIEHDGFSLYQMNANYDSNLVKDIIGCFTQMKKSYQDDLGEVDKAADSSVKGILGIETEAKMDFRSFGCTAFSAKDSNGVSYMGRNYDFAINTSCICVKCEPKRFSDKKQPFKSIAFAALSNLQGVKDPTTCDEGALMLLPFMCLDGINEKGVSIAVLVVDIKDGVGVTHQKEKEINIFTTLAIRYVLDWAESTESAIALLQNLNMYAVGGMDYHFFISDAACDSRVVEYNYKKKTMRDFTVTRTKAATNFYVFDKETFGHGHGRYKTVMNNLKIEKLSRNDLWRTLMDTSQTYEEGNTTSNTQWSILFNNTEKSAEIAIQKIFLDKHTIYVN